MKVCVVFATISIVFAAPIASAQSIEAGRALALRVCAACHGETGVSVADTIPNLGGQRARYLEEQLRALKEGARKNSMMNTIARQLSASDIVNIAAYFSSQPGAGSQKTSDFMPTIAKTNAAMPADHRATFKRYHVANFPELKQVRHYFANATAVEAARAGKPLPNGSMLLTEVYSVKLDDRLELAKDGAGLFVPNQLLFYSVMAREAGWGKDFPEILRNEDWNYAAFSSGREPRPGINHAECLACHKSMEKADFAFTLKELGEAAKSR